VRARLPGRADHLLAALDPEAAHVVVLCGDPGRGWRDLAVDIGTEERPTVRRVRRVSFELLVTGAEAAELGPHLRAEHDGSLHCYQFAALPDDGLHLPLAVPRQHLAQLMRGKGLDLMIELPHDNEVALLTSVDRALLQPLLERLRRHMAAQQPAAERRSPAAHRAQRGSR